MAGSADKELVRHFYREAIVESPPISAGAAATAASSSGSQRPASGRVHLDRDPARHDGLISRAWDEVDVTSVMQQLGG